MADPPLPRRSILLGSLAALLWLLPRRARALGPELPVASFEGRKLVRARFRDAGNQLDLTFDDGRTLQVGVVRPPLVEVAGLWAGYLDPARDEADRKARRSQRP